MSAMVAETELLAELCEELCEERFVVSYGEILMLTCTWCEDFICWGVMPLPVSRLTAWTEEHECGAPGG